MAITGDVAELVHEQTYLGQVVNNVYYFQATATAGLTALAAWFETNVVPAVRSNQVDLVTHTNLRLRNLMQVGEVHEEPLTGVGGVASGNVELPSFMAYGLRLEHLNGAVRPGFKRLVGVDETSISDALIASTRVIALSAVVNLLVNPPSVANADWVHVVVGRICETPNPTPGAVPACLKYRLPETVLEAETGLVTAVEIFSQPTTQNSRKWYT